MNKAPLLLLPGLLCDEGLWRLPADSLQDVASPVIADLTRDDSMEAMARRALSVAPEKFALAGLSMGGYVAFEIMRQAPERVLRLAFFDTSAAPDSPERIQRRKAGISSLEVGRFSGVTNRLLPQLIHPTLIDGPVGLELKAMAARVGSDAFLRQQSAILGRADFRPVLGSIQVPTLVAVGDSDVLTPPQDAWDIHRGIANSAFHVFGKCGHLPALEKPAETAALVRLWLTM